MTVALWLIGFVVAATALAYMSAPAWLWAAAVGAFLLGVSAAAGASAGATTLVLIIFAASAAILTFAPLRRALVSDRLLDAFRTSGLSHLTAVSGQNVAYVLAAALPLLRRLRAWWRWAATVGLVTWFMAITRFEPSILRAGVMALLAATAYVRGYQVRPVRVLALAVLLLVLVDPLLVWSVGFWLSVGATAGVCVVGPWLLPRWMPCRRPPRYAPARGSWSGPAGISRCDRSGPVRRARCR